MMKRMSFFSNSAVLVPSMKRFLCTLIALSSVILLAGDAREAVARNVYGKIRVVSIGEDYKVRVVSIGEDLKVRVVSIGENSVGRWRFVDIGEDFKIRFVDIGEDFKIRFVNIGEGVN